MGSVKQIQKAMAVACVAGVLVSIYALRVELKKEKDDDYEALCDISEHVSCSQVLSSRWGRGFGIIGSLLGEDSVFNQPNSVAGIIFYALVGTINQSTTPTASRILLVLSIMSNLMSIYLASILYFILHDFCIVCVTTYTINAVLLALSWKRQNYALSGEKKKN